MQHSGIPQGKVLQASVSRILYGAPHLRQADVVGDLRDFQRRKTLSAQTQQLLGIVHVVEVRVPLPRIGILCAQLTVNPILAVVDFLKVGVLIAPHMQPRHHRLVVFGDGDARNVPPIPDRVAPVLPQGRTQVYREVVKFQLPAPLFQKLLLDAAHDVLLQDVQVIQRIRAHGHIAGGKARPRQQLLQCRCRVDTVRVAVILRGFDIHNVLVRQVIAQVRGFHLQGTPLSADAGLQAADAVQLRAALVLVA